MATSTFVHGKSGQFLNGPTAMNVLEFSFDHTVEEDDITHTGANGAYVPLAGIEKATGDVTLVYDSSNKPTVSPQSLKAGVTGTLTLKPDGADAFSFLALVTGFSFKSGPQAKAVKVQCKFVSSGAITTP